MQKVRDVMTPDPAVLPAQAPVTDAARLMRDLGIGSVFVADNGVVGILTDRDITVRALADARDPRTTAVGEICSQDDIAFVNADDDVERAEQIMRSRAVRRLPVIDEGRLTGVISLGDIAISRDEDTALADISAAPANV